MICTFTHPSRDIYWWLLNLNRPGFMLTLKQTKIVRIYIDVEDEYATILKFKFNDLTHDSVNAANSVCRGFRIPNPFLTTGPVPKFDIYLI